MKFDIEFNLTQGLDLMQNLRLNDAVSFAGKANRFDSGFKYSIEQLTIQNDDLSPSTGLGLMCLE